MKTTHRLYHREAGRLETASYLALGLAGVLAIVLAVGDGFRFGAGLDEVAARLATEPSAVAVSEPARPAGWVNTGTVIRASGPRAKAAAPHAAPVSGRPPGSPLPG